MAQKHVIEVVIDEEQLLGELLMEDTGNQLQDSLLHGSACPVQLLFKGGQVTTKVTLWLSTHKFVSLTGTQTPEATGYNHELLMGNKYWCER